MIILASFESNYSLQEMPYSNETKKIFSVLECVTALFFHDSKFS